MATSPIRTLRVEPLADHGLFVLVDPESPSWPFHDDADLKNDQIVVETQAGVGFKAAAGDFYPDLRISIYEQEPTESPPGPWDHVRQVSITVRSGWLFVRSIMGDIAGTFELESGDWSVRAHVRGRAEAKRRGVDGETFFHGGEEWVLQLWPAA